MEHSPRANATHQLSDGTHVLVRPVTPEDRALLAQGFAHFGPASRYLRFFTVKSSLSESELRYLTELDGMRHFALGALSFDAQGEATPLGVARFVRPDETSEVAEAAVAVVDEAQGKGLGKLLLRELGDAAYARGVRRFRCSVLAQNEAMRNMLRALDPKMYVVERAAGVEELEIELHAPRRAHGEHAVRGGLERLLRMAAERLVKVRSLTTDGRALE